MALDTKDLGILSLLQDDATTPQAEIGRRVGLSASAVNERIRRLEREGVIRRWTVLLDEQKVGAEITVFIEAYVESPAHEREFVALVSDLPEVLECHFVTGDFSCLVKAKVPDRRALRELVLERINSLKGVRQTRTYIVLETVKEDTRLALDATGAGGATGKRKGRKG